MSGLSILKRALKIPGLDDPSTTPNDDHVDRIPAVIRGNRRLTIREVADEVGISIGSCH